jgi:hypothetical protein
MSNRAKTNLNTQKRKEKTFSRRVERFMSVLHKYLLCNSNLFKIFTIICCSDAKSRFSGDEGSFIRASNFPSSFMLSVMSSQKLWPRAVACSFLTPPASFHYGFQYAICIN